jgi:hypothetical protein
MIDMTPPPINFVLARSWRIAAWTGIISGATIVIWACFPTPAMIANPSYWFSFSLALLTVLPLGWLIGVLTLGVILTHVAGQRNGAPFCVGDSVYVLRGRNQGRVSQVYTLFQGHSVRVALGDEAKKNFSDVFGWNEICRVEKPKPDGP